MTPQAEFQCNYGMPEKMNTPHINKYNKRGYASIWLGDIETEENIETYITQFFVDDFGFTFANTGRAEAATHPEPINIGELIKPASESRYFIDDVISFCEKNGIVSAKCALILYGCEYLAEHVLNTDAPLRFLGAFKYSGLEE